MKEGSWLEKASFIQKKIDRRISNIPTLSFVTYLFFMSMVFILMGVMLWLYCIFSYIDPWMCDMVSSPVTYLVLGVVLFCFFMLEKMNDSNL